MKNSANWSEGPVPVIKPENLTNILASSCDIAFMLSANGTILSLLLDNQKIDHPPVTHWAGKPMQSFLTSESVSKFDNSLKELMEFGQTSRSIELNHTDRDDWQYPVRYAFHLVGPDNAALMLGHDLRMMAETQEQLIQAQLALERGYEERREFDARYRMVMATTRDAFVFVSASDGRIRDVNAAAANLLGSDRDDLLGSPVAQEFKHRRRGEFVDTLLGLAVSDFGNDIRAQTVRGQREVSITPTVFRAAGERMIICRLQPESGQMPTDDQLRDSLAALFQKSTDAIVLSDTRGIVQDVNEAFLEIADVASLSEVKLRSLADFLQRGQIDLSVMLENAERSGHMRVYATKLANDFGPRAAVEISVVKLDDRDGPLVGFIIRDASRAEAVRTPAKAANQSSISNQNVAERVGSAPLKEIVAETNEVIERMCIETAVELTRNNRAAAAEMLGLSRQSLYVKLRKYGLLKREDKD